MNFVLDRFLKFSIRFYTPSEDVLIEVSKFKLSISEQETLRYVAGYVAFSLKKNIRNKQSPEGKAIYQLLQSWGNKDDETIKETASILDYTKVWVDLVNRGGLFKVSDAFYTFIEQIEKMVRTVINLNLLATYCGQDLHDVLMKKLSKSRFIEESWSNLTCSISNQSLVNKLKEKIFSKWINIRAHAFVKVWLQTMRLKLLKKGEKVTHQGEPALRKTLTSGKTKVQSNKTKSTPTKTCSQIVASKKLKLAKKVVQKNKSKKK